MGGNPMRMRRQSALLLRRDSAAVRVVCPPGAPCANIRRSVGRWGPLSPTAAHRNFDPALRAVTRRLQNADSSKCIPPLSSPRKGAWVKGEWALAGRRIYFGRSGVSRLPQLLGLRCEFRGRICNVFYRIRSLKLDHRLRTAVFYEPEGGYHWPAHPLFHGFRGFRTCNPSDCLLQVTGYLFGHHIS